MEPKLDYGRGFHRTRAVKICKPRKIEEWNSKIKYFHCESVYAPFRSPFKCLFLFQSYNWQYFNKSNKLGFVPSASSCDSNFLSQERLPGQTELLTSKRNEEQDYTLLNSMTKFQLSSGSISTSPKE